MRKQGIKIVDISISIIAIVSLSILLLLWPQETTQGINVVKEKTMNVLSPMYLWIGFAAVVFSIYVCFSKYGDIKFSDDKPEHSTISWLSMIFCTGMGSNLLYWSAIEWIYYYSAPPMGAEPFSVAAAELSSVYGGFHWSITGWTIYAIGAIALCIRYYNRKIYRLSLSDCMEGILGDKVSKGIGRRIIELIFLFGTIGGSITMISFVVPMYCNNIAYLFNIENTLEFQMIFIGAISIVFIMSTFSGLNKGMKHLSNLNIVVAIVLVVVVLILGPTNFIFKSMTNAIGYMAQNFIQMSLWTDPIGNSGFTENWTGFYWAWWIGLAPSMWIFITKISKGRTVRATLSGVILSGSLGCWLYFGVISNYGIYNQINGKIDFVNILTNHGPEQAVTDLVLSLPFGDVMLVIWTLVGIIFIITTMDSQAYTLAVSTTLNLNEDEHPSTGLKIFWCLLLTLLPAILIRSGANVSTLQTYATTTAIPIAFITIIAIISGYKYLKEEKQQCKYIDFENVKKVT